MNILKVHQLSLALQITIMTFSIMSFVSETNQIVADTPSPAVEVFYENGRVENRCSASRVAVTRELSERGMYFLDSAELYTSVTVRSGVLQFEGTVKNDYRLDAVIIDGVIETNEEPTRTPGGRTINAAIVTFQRHSVVLNPHVTVRDGTFAEIHYARNGEMADISHFTKASFCLARIPRKA